MEIDLVNGKVVFNGLPYTELEMDEKIEADSLLAEIRKGQTLEDLIEIAKARAREEGLELRVRISDE